MFSNKINKREGSTNSYTRNVGKKIAQGVAPDPYYGFHALPKIIWKDQIKKVDSPLTCFLFLVNVPELSCLYAGYLPPCPCYMFSAYSIWVKQDT